MTYGNPVGVALPVVGFTSDAAGEQAILNFLSAVDLVLSAKVTPAGMDINSNLSFLSGVTASGIVDLLKASFTNQTSALSAATHPVSLYSFGANGNLGYNDAAGNQIQLTANGVVNISSTGGVTGAGYGTGGVEVNYDSVNVKYRMRSGSTADSFADVECDDLRLNDGSGNFLSLLCPSLGADYSITFPTAVPGSSQLLQMSSAGVLSASNSNLNSLTLTSGQHVTVAGSGLYKRPNRARKFATANGQVTTSSATVQPSGGWSTGVAPVDIIVPVVFDQGEQINNVSCIVSPAAAGTITMRLFATTDDLGMGLESQIGSSAVSSGTGAQTLTISSLTETVSNNNRSYFVRFTTTINGLHRIGSLLYIETSVP